LNEHPLFQGFKHFLASCITFADIGKIHGKNTGAGFRGCLDYVLLAWPDKTAFPSLTREIPIFVPEINSSTLSYV
jgi:hypothetical protein